jgi:RHS repeat-associated protein
MWSVITQRLFSTRTRASGILGFHGSAGHSAVHMRHSDQRGTRAVRRRPRRGPRRRLAASVGLVLSILVQPGAGFGEMAAWLTKLVGPPVSRGALARLLPIAASAPIALLTGSGRASAISITLTAVSTNFNNPIGIDYHPLSNKVLVSVNYPSGTPDNFELVASDGTRTQFSNVSGLTDEVKIATVRSSACQGGFNAGELFVGTGTAGVIARISPDGTTVRNPWVTLSGETGLMRGGLFQDRFCAFGGDLIAATTTGNVWRVTSAGTATRLAAGIGGSAFLEGVTSIPNNTQLYGPWAGKILTGAEQQNLLYTIDAQGTVQSWNLGIALPEEMRVIPANENFFGVDFRGRVVWGAGADQFASIVGDIVIPEESSGKLWQVHWNAATSSFQTTLLAQVSQWEQITFAPAGINPITATLPTEPAPPFTALPGLPGTGATPDPVLTNAGSYAYSHTDLALPGRGPSPAFTRGYNGMDTRIGPLGPAWTHNYNIRLRNPGDGTADVILVNTNGRSDRYVFNAGTYTRPSGVTTQLVKNATGPNAYTATLLDQTAWNFDAGGRLTSIVDRYGNQSVLGYNATGQLVSVSDPAGRDPTGLRLAYDPVTARLTSVTDWSSRVVSFGYDGNNRLSSVTDRNGKVTTYCYDDPTTCSAATPTQHLAKITDANNHAAVSMTYDAQGRVFHQWDALGADLPGRRTEFGYTTNPDGSIQSTTVTFPFTSFQPSFAPTVTDTYNSQAQLVTRAQTASSTEAFTLQFGYTAGGFQNQVVDATNNTTNFCFDASGNLTRRVGPSAFDAKQGISYRPVTFFKYDAANNLTLTVPPEGMGSPANAADCAADLSATANNSVFRTTIQYDNSLKPQTVTVTRRFTDPDAPGSQQTPVTTYAYDVSTSGGNPGRLLQVTSPRNNPTAFTYNTAGTQAGMLAAVTGPPVPENASGDKTSYTYDSVGRRLTMVDPIGNAGGAGDHTWTYQYDNEDRPTQVQAPQPSGFAAKLTTVMSYDPVGNRLSVQDPNGQFTRYLYDARDSLQEVDQSATATDPNGDPNTIVTNYTYDNLGNLQRVKRASASVDERATDYLYDGLNRLRKEIQYPNWTATTPTLLTQYTYDGNGNRTQLVDPLNQTTGFSYDVLNRLTGITYTTPAAGTSATANVTYTYDANNNRMSMADGTGTTSYAYDELDRPTSVTTPAGPKTVGYRYDLDGNRKKLIYPDNTAISYTFDAADRLQSLADWANRTTSYNYFQDSRVNTVTNVNGTTAAFGYDEARRLLSVQNKQSSGNTIDSHTYALDQVGNRKQLDETLAVPGFGGLAQTRTTYGYDNLYRLKSADTAPLISAVVPVALAPTSVAITWETAAPSNSQVQYGTTSALGSSTVLDSTLVTTHRQTLTGLTGGTTYYFAVMSQDGAGNSATSNTFTLTTLPTSPLGDQTIEQSHDSNPAGLAQAFPYTASTTGSINRLSWYVDVTNTASTIAVGLYSDSAGHPGTLQTAGLITSPANGTWNVASVPSGNLTASTQYWLAILTPFGSGTVQFRDGGGTGTSETSSLANMTALPAIWVTGQTWTTGSASAFAANVANTSLDLQPPALQLTSHTNGQTVSGANVTITVSASDAIGVSYVQLLVDDLPLGAPVIASPYSATWDTTLLPNGGHSLSAWAQDAAGNVGFANKVYVVVSNTGTNPVAVPLAGNQTKELQSTTQVAGQANAFQYTATASGTATQLLVFLDDGTIASQVQVGLYSDTAGHPGTLLTQGTINTPVNWAWNAVPIAPVSLTSNTKYWIAVLSPNGLGKLKLLYQGTGGGGTNETSLSTTLTTLPSSWTTGATSSQQLMSAYVVQQPQDGGLATTYTYDKVGNRLSRTRLGITTSYSYDKTDRITQAGLLAMTVNGAGNETARGLDSFAYDQANRLTTASPAGGLSTTYVYDGDGKRMKRTVGTNPQINYTYDVGTGTPMLLDDSSHKYVYGLTLLYETDESGSLQSVYQTDGLGSERALTDSNGSLTQLYQYEEFGVPIVMVGGSSQPFGFTGEQRDQDPRLQYLRARYYDPGIGRFIQSDPLEKNARGVGGWNRYSYVGNNPACLTDPSGLAPAKSLLITGCVELPVLVPEPAPHFELQKSCPEDQPNDEITLQGPCGSAKLLGMPNIGALPGVAAFQITAESYVGNILSYVYRVEYTNIFGQGRFSDAIVGGRLLTRPRSRILEILTQVPTGSGTIGAVLNLGLVIQGRSSICNLTDRILFFIPFPPQLPDNIA